MKCPPTKSAPECWAGLDFDAASAAWRANKVEGPRTAFKYRCTATTASGERCARAPAFGKLHPLANSLCALHQRAHDGATVAAALLLNLKEPTHASATAASKQ